MWTMVRLRAVSPASLRGGERVDVFLAISLGDCEHDRVGIAMRDDAGEDAAPGQRLDGGARIATAQPATISRIADWAKKVETRGMFLVPITMVAIKAKSS